MIDLRLKYGTNNIPIETNHIIYGMIQYVSILQKPIISPYPSSWKSSTTTLKI